VPRRRTAQQHEVVLKSDAQIERETAKKWAERAVACYAIFLSRGDAAWALRYDNYRHEALEHAAVVGDRGATVRQVQDWIDRAVERDSKSLANARKTVESKRRRRR
jgi:hypothetical protein